MPTTFLEWCAAAGVGLLALMAFFSWRRASHSKKQLRNSQAGLECVEALMDQVADTNQFVQALRENVESLAGDARVALAFEATRREEFAPYYGPPQHQVGYSSDGYGAGQQVIEAAPQWAALPLGHAHELTQQNGTGQHHYPEGPYDHEEVIDAAKPRTQEPPQAAQATVVDESLPLAASPTDDPGWFSDNGGPVGAEVGEFAPEPEPVSVEPEAPVVKAPLAEEPQLVTEGDPAGQEGDFLQNLRRDPEATLRNFARTSLAFDAKYVNPVLMETLQDMEPVTVPDDAVRPTE